MAQFDLKTFIRANPALHDLALRERRRFGEAREPLYEALDRFSESRKGALRFIAAGVGDGLSGSPLREFILRDGWRGVLIEADGRNFARLCRHFTHKKFPHLRLVRAALVGREGEEAPFYAVNDEALRTLPYAQRESALAAGGQIRAQVLSRLVTLGLTESAIAAEDVAGITVEAAIRAHFADRHFDLLMLDLNGQEGPILAALDLEAVRPGAILIQAGQIGALRPHLTRHLVQAGYAIWDLAGPHGPHLLALGV
jgi:hypothetical protein